jgi:hypothetical protein
MSVDYDIVCDACKLKTHAGKSNLTGSYFGRSSGDTSVAEFAFEHAYHNIEGGVRIVISDTAEKKRSDSYLDEDNSDPAMVAAVATLKAGIEHAEALGQSVDSFLDGSTADFVQRFGETLVSPSTGIFDPQPPEEQLKQTIQTDVTLALAEHPLLLEIGYAALEMVQTHRETKTIDLRRLAKATDVWEAFDRKRTSGQ